METRRHGREISYFRVSPSPCLHVPLFSCPLVFLSPLPRSESMTIFLKRLPGVRRSWSCEISRSNSAMTINKQSSASKTEQMFNVSNPFGFEASINSVKEKKETIYA